MFAQVINWTVKIFMEFLRNEDSFIPFKPKRVCDCVSHSENKCFLVRQRGTKLRKKMYIANPKALHPLENIKSCKKRLKTYIFSETIDLESKIIRDGIVT